MLWSITFYPILPLLIWYQCHCALLATTLLLGCLLLLIILALLFWSSSFPTFSLSLWAFPGFYLSTEYLLGAGRPPLLNPKEIPSLSLIMALSVFSLPKIRISFAPPQEAEVEPFSPVPSAPITGNDDGFRSALLSPPVPLSKHLSPLCPPEVPLKGPGLERERFEQLLKTSRERALALGNKRKPDLRKELAVKSHQTKQGAFSSSDL